MRRGEALGLRWTDVDFDSGRLHLVQTIISVRGKVMVGEPKTLRGRHPIALDPATVAVLKAHRKAMLEERMKLGAAFTDEGLLFHRPDGRCLRPEGVGDTFKRTVRRLDLPPLILKGLRHTWATLALEKGIHPRVVQERLGHSTIAITLGHLQPRQSHPPRRSRRDRRQPGPVGDSTTMGTPIEDNLRDEDPSEWILVIRGRPLTVEGLLLAAGRKVTEFTWRGEPVAAVSAEVTGPGRTTDDVLAGPRLRTRRTYASAPLSTLVDGGFAVLPTFAAPHVSIVLPAYDEESVRALVAIFGPEHLNPHYLRTR